MEEFRTIENKKAECADKDINCHNSAFLAKSTKTIKNVLQKLVVFICYGPGVLGFLWLIGRILRR